MTSNIIARLSGGVATFQEEDRGDVAGGGGGDSGADEAAKAAEAAAASAAAEADKARAAREAGITIPKERFDQAVAKERQRAEAAEKELAKHREAEQARQAVLDVKKVEAEISALEDKLEAALAEGTPEQRKALRAEIRAKERQLASAEARQVSAQDRELAVEQVRYDSVVDRVEADYPFLDTQNEDFSQALANEVLELKAGFEGTGLSSSAALKKAVKFLKPQLDAAKKADKADDADAKAAAEEAARKKAEQAAAAGGDAAKKAEDEAARRKAAATAKGAAAQKGQPAAAAGSASLDKDQKVVDVKEMSDAEFAKLSDAEKRRLRGD